MAQENNFAFLTNYCRDIVIFHKPLHLHLLKFVDSILLNRASFCINIGAKNMVE